MTIYSGNNQIIGLRSNDEQNETIFGNLYELEKHIHSISYVYPTLSAGIQLTAGNGWALGAGVQIMPANTAATYFDIHYINIEVLSANAVYEIHFFSDAACTELIGKARFTRVNNNESINALNFMSPLIIKTKPIYGKLASSSNGAQATISIFYHEY